MRELIPVPGDHVCVPFSSSDTYLDVVRRFVRSGLDAGEQVMCYTAQFMPVAVVAMLEASGDAVQAAVGRGQVMIASAYDAYLGEGRFDADAMIDRWREAVRDAREAGYQGLRVVADMTWAAGDVPGTERLAWYEAEVNRVYAGGFARAACMYDRRVFTAAQLRDYAAAHPGSVEADGHDGPLLRLAHTTAPRGLALSGQADLSTRIALEAVLDGLPDDVPGEGPITIDLSDVTFLDVAAATALLRLARRLPELRVTGATSHHARILTLLAEREDVPVNVEPPHPDDRTA